MQSTPAVLSFDEEGIRQRHAAKRRRNNWLAILLIATPLLWAVPTFFYLRAQTNFVNTRCNENLTVLSKQIMTYSASNNGYLPDAKKWISVLDTSEKSLHCPSDLDQIHASSYAMNANLSGKKLDEIKDPRNTILLYETTSKASAPFGTGKDLVSIGKDTVGQGRHNTIAYRFNYYLMADGTVRQPANAAEVKTYKWTP